MCFLESDPSGAKNAELRGAVLVLWDRSEWVRIFSPLAPEMNAEGLGFECDGHQIREICPGEMESSYEADGVGRSYLNLSSQGRL